MEEQVPPLEKLRTARIQQRGSFVGTGCLVQALGLILGVTLTAVIPLIGWLIGLVVAVGMLISGGRMAIKYECSNCHNPIASKRVKLCPACHARF